MSKSMNWLLTTNETHIEIVTFITLGKNPRVIVHKLPGIWGVCLLRAPKLKVDLQKSELRKVVLSDLHSFCRFV